MFGTVRHNAINMFTSSTLQDNATFNDQQDDRFPKRLQHYKLCRSMIRFWLRPTTSPVHGNQSESVQDCIQNHSENIIKDADFFQDSKYLLHIHHASSCWAFFYDTQFCGWVFVSKPHPNEVAVLWRLIIRPENSEIQFSTTEPDASLILSQFVVTTPWVTTRLSDIRNKQKIWWTRKFSDWRKRNMQVHTNHGWRF